MTGGDMKWRCANCAKDQDTEYEHVRKDGFRSVYYWCNKPVRVEPDYEKVPVVIKKYHENFKIKQDGMTSFLVYASESFKNVGMFEVPIRTGMSLHIPNKHFKVDFRLSNKRKFLPFTGRLRVSNIDGEFVVIMHKTNIMGGSRIKNIDINVGEKLGYINVTYKFVLEIVR